MSKTLYVGFWLWGAGRRVQPPKPPGSRVNCTILFVFSLTFFTQVFESYLDQLYYFPSPQSPYFICITVRLICCCLYSVGLFAYLGFNCLFFSRWQGHLKHYSGSHIKFYVKEIKGIFVCVTFSLSLVPYPPFSPPFFHPSLVTSLWLFLPWKRNSYLFTGLCIDNKEAATALLYGSIVLYRQLLRGSQEICTQLLYVLGTAGLTT